ncbi:DNA glycosylase [Crepidotus variabilis]|uniref:DNA glycosylase n=1 Tax=Crepidotus variabilis TaxID=179855 RepID=A0A9P6E3K5_9AGAR|nr:DNA glycosylase [Crepidotus variabilis]
MLKRRRSSLDSAKSLSVIPELKTQKLVVTNSLATKKQKLQADYSTTSPFPNFAHPTATETQEVYDLLCKHHAGGSQVKRASGSSKRTPNVIESLISTILSQNTTASNSTRAKAGLDAAFGRNDYASIVEAPVDRVAASIRCGGLANKKAVTIQKLLNSIKARHGDYSLQHLAASGEGKKMDDEAIMKELVSYDGVGPKTASCVLLFCLGRDSFAVDTHVFRLSKLLGWVPAGADRVLTQAHLDLRVPNDLKYGLHVLFIRHGRACRGCKSSSSIEKCILKDYLHQLSC